MNKKIIKFALIGCGAITKKHAVSIGRNKNAKLTAVCDIDKERAKETGEKYEVPWHVNAHKMIKNEDIDAISILTPSGTHAQIAMDLIKYKKHFVLEKPLALRLEDADSIIEACDKANVKIFVVQQNRFNPPIKKLKEAIDNNKFGKPVLGSVRVRWCRTQDYYDQKKWRGTWALDGGVFTNQASHHIDMLVWLMGDVEKVMSMSSTRLVKIEAEDTGVSILQFKNGALGVIEATTATRPKDLEGSISILGEKGSVEIGGYFMNELKTWNFAGEEKKKKSIFETYGKTPEIFAWNHTEFLKDVVESILKNKRGLIDGLEARKSLELINAIYESAESGKEIYLRFKPRKCKLGINNNE
jgi:predicted dehydrogenase